MSAAPGFLGALQQDLALLPWCDLWSRVIKPVRTSHRYSRVRRTIGARPARKVPEYQVVRLISPREFLELLVAEKPR